MAPKRRKNSGRCNSGKIRYRDEIAAQIALASTARRDRAEENYYRCPQCSGFHLTKNPKKHPKAIEKDLGKLVKQIRYKKAKHAL